MSSRSSIPVAVLFAAMVAAAAAADLRVCADPGNLPFSNSREEGFENRLAQLVARDLGRTVRYVWTPQRGEFLRKTLNAGRCDLFMGLPSDMDEAASTRPYYRSSYVFVSRRNRHLGIRSFDDGRLKRLRIGVHAFGDDATLPAAQALLERGLANNIAWYRLYPDLSKPDGPAALVKAVERGDVDIAIAWGPLAGYVARNAPVPLDVVPVSPQIARRVPLAFDISMAVRRGNTELLSQLNAIIARRGPEIRRLLAGYGVPMVSPVAFATQNR